MDKQIGARFERVEQALTTLVDSITKYNPSVGAANSLTKAEKELSQGLQEVQTHQNNHLRLEQLRTATTSLDSQIRETLVSLATTRKELVTTPATAFGSDNESNSFTYTELLTFARRISKTTLPFMGASLEGMGLDKEGNPLPDADQDGQDGQDGQVVVSQSQSTVAVASENDTTTATNGATSSSQSQSQSQPTTQTTLAGPTPSSTPLAPPPQSSSSTPLPHPNTLPTTLGTLGIHHPTSLPSLLHRKANPRFNSLFYPFPDQPKILSGCLVANQLLAESGVDPRNHDPVAEANRLEVEEQLRLEQAELERCERERQSVKIRQEREDQMAARRRAVVELERKNSLATATTATAGAVGGAGGAGAVVGEGGRGGRLLTQTGGDGVVAVVGANADSATAGVIGSSSTIATGRLGMNPAAAAGDAISPTTEKIGAKAEFKFAADSDED